MVKLYSNIDHVKLVYEGADVVKVMEEWTEALDEPAARHFVDMPRMKLLLAMWPETGYETNDVISLWNYALTRGISTGMFLQNYAQNVDEATVQTAGSVPMASPRA